MLEHINSYTYSHKHQSIEVHWSTLEYIGVHWSTLEYIRVHRKLFRNITIAK